MSRGTISHLDPRSELSQSIRNTITKLQPIPSLSEPDIWIDYPGFESAGDGFLTANLRLCPVAKLEG